MGDLGRGDCRFRVTLCYKDNLKHDAMQVRLRFVATDSSAASHLPGGMSTLTGKLSGYALAHYRPIPVPHCSIVALPLTRAAVIG